MPYTPDTFTNYAVSSVAGGAAGRGTPLQATDTTCYVPIGDGAKFPTTATGPFNVVIGTTEIAKCTARAGDVLTLARGQEGTTAGTYAVSTSLQLVVSALNLTDAWTAINSGRPYIVEDYGAIADGVTDNTTAIQNAINAANAAGGGKVLFAAGTYVTQTLTIYSKIQLVGVGSSTTILQLKNGTNGDLIWGGSSNAALINVTNTTQGNGNTGGLGEWSIQHMTLGGNKGNQTSGPSYCVRIYGYDFLLFDVVCGNGFSGGVLFDWNGNTIPSPASMEARMIACKVHDCNGMGVTWGGPHDSQMTNCVIFKSAQHNLYIGPHAEGFAWTNNHCWGLSAGMVQVLCEGQTCSFNGGEIEGSPVVQLVILAAWVDVHGVQIYGTATPSSAIQLGQQAGNTPYVNSAYQSGGLTTAQATNGCSIDCTIETCSGANGAIWFANEFTGDSIKASIWLPAAGVPFTGTVAANTNLDLMVGGLATQYSIRINGGYTVYGGGNGVAVPATNGTINTVGETLIRVNPAAAITGVILQAGTYDGQQAIVLNKSAFSITFAIAGTSHVADGVSDIIAASTSRGYVWDATSALWYRMA